MNYLEKYKYEINQNKIKVKNKDEKASLYWVMLCLSVIFVVVFTPLILSNTAKEIDKAYNLSVMFFSIGSFLMYVFEQKISKKLKIENKNKINSIFIENKEEIELEIKKILKHPKHLNIEEQNILLSYVEKNKDFEPTEILNIIVKYYDEEQTNKTDDFLIRKNQYLLSRKVAYY